MHSIGIKLDKLRNLRYTTREVARTKQLYGIDVSNPKSTDIGTPELAVFLFAGLAWEDKELDLDKTYDLLDIALQEYGVEGTFEKVKKAQELSFGIKETPATIEDKKK